MNNELSLLVKDIPRDNIEKFVKNTKASATVKKTINKISVDYSWVDVLDESIPYLDTIIRNPRRFIVSEEDIVPIEKTKKVSEESIKHLAVHTQLIQEVDDDGMVKPIKLLNVFREETIDLYENRFIYSLITNLYTFVRNQLTYKEQSASNKEERSLKYEGTTNYNNQEIKINLDLICQNKEEEVESENLLKEREEKIKHIQEILEDFMSTKFMKAMVNATPVRSPIRKTNVILKEQNFIKALALWEFLESYQIEKPVKEYNEEVELTNSKFKKDFGLTYFLNYSILNEDISKRGRMSFDTTDLPKTVYEQAKKFDVDENELKDEIINEIKRAHNYKEEQKNGVRSTFKSFINTHYSKINKAVILFK